MWIKDHLGDVKYGNNLTLHFETKLIQKLHFKRKKEKWWHLLKRNWS